MFEFLGKASSWFHRFLRFLQRIFDANDLLNSWYVISGKTHYSLYSNTTGNFNVANGSSALYSNTTGNYNVANGFSSLNFNTTGYNNTANGYQSLYSNTTGNYNTANGNQSLRYNTTGYENTANGTKALFSNTTGNYNTANGSLALFSNTTGEGNVANGYYALLYNTTGNYNTANGSYALRSNTTGNYNSANGANALYANTTGIGNVANGYQALFKNTAGHQSLAEGYQALYNSRGKYNIGLGYRGGYNITTGINNIAIANLGNATDTGVIRIGTTGTHTATLIAGINGATATGGVAVYIDANGQLGTVTSSRRFKNEIKTMGNVSDKLLKLRPVTFRYKSADSKGGHPLQYGLIAEDVAKVFPDLVQYDKQGKPFTIYYHLITPMILNELQKSAKKVESVQASHKVEVTALNTKVTTLTAELVSLKQAQAEQQKLLAKLAAYVQNSKNNAPIQKVNIVQH